jgi:acid phosphatase family membrane protein YuiD
MAFNVSPYLIAICIAWLISHIIKSTFRVLAKEKFNFRQIFASGGMPSSHSATAIALATVIGLKDGLDSPVFAVSALFSLIVMYDAVKVRRSSGEQGYAIRELIKEQNSSVKLPRVAKGHEPVEVFFGALLGLTVGAIVFLATK